MTDATDRLSVLSVDFFHYYDELQQGAANLRGATSELKEASKALDYGHKDLSALQKRLRSTLASIKEQKDRIELVSSHWFYGTTALQPQLWFRGGCEGKISRAKVKLTEANKRKPILESSIRKFKEEELPRLQANVELKQERFEVAEKAAQTRARMFKRVISEYPSEALRSIEEQTSSLKERASLCKSNMDCVQAVKDKLSEGQALLKEAERLLNNALQHNGRCESLQTGAAKTTAANPIPRAKTTAANPIPRRGHQHNRRRGLDEDRTALDSSTSQALRENDYSNEEFARAYEKAREAERVIWEAVHSLPNRIHDPVAHGHLLSNARVVKEGAPTLLPHYYSCPKSRGLNIQQELSSLTRSQKILKESIFPTINQMVKETQQDLQRLKNEQMNLSTRMEQEKSRIFEKVRARAETTMAGTPAASRDDDLFE